MAWLAVLAVLAVLSLSACSGDDSSGSGRDSSPAESTSTSIASTTGPDDVPPTSSERAGGDSPTAALLESICTGAATIVDAGVIASPDISEASGLAASRRNPGAWWIHNDSGDSARLFAIDAAGALLATVALDGADARDWESIAVGPPEVDGAATVYLGDTGDNSVMRDPSGGRGSIRVYRFTEPRLASGEAGSAGTAGEQLRASVDTLVFEFPEQAHDVEALLVDPVSGDLVVVTKDWQRTGVSQVFRASADAAAGSTTTLELVGSVPLEPGTLVTAADTSPDGAVVALRSYGAVHLYERPAGEPLWAAFETVPCEGPSPGEIQGESLGFDLDGASYLTVSEGAGQVLHRTQP